MQPKRWILLALFLGAALISAWLFPSLSLGWGQAASAQPETVLPDGINGSLLLRSGEALDVKAEPNAIQAAEAQAAIYLPLWEDDYQLYLPITRR